MLEIIALIFLTQRIGNVASRKGLPTLRWKIFTILSWILFEFLGIMFAVAMFGKESLFAVFSIGIMSAFGGYLFVKFILDKQPDSLDQDIDNIGR